MMKGLEDRINRYAALKKHAMNDELIARLDVATGPDQILDRDIELYRGHCIKHPDTKMADRYVLSIYTHPDYGAGQGYLPAQFTGSIDAAMTLVPEGWYIELKGPRAYLHLPVNSPNYWSAHMSSFNYENMATGWGATPSLAICIAALRAQEKDDD